MKLDSPEAIAHVTARLAQSSKVQGILAKQVRDTGNAVKAIEPPKRYTGKRDLHKLARLAVEMQELTPSLYAETLLSRTKQRNRKRNTGKGT